jgi:hypothetical protein
MRILAPYTGKNRPPAPMLEGSRPAESRAPLQTCFDTMPIRKFESTNFVISGCFIETYTPGWHFHFKTQHDENKTGQISCFGPF